MNRASFLPQQALSVLLGKTAFEFDKPYRAFAIHQPKFQTLQKLLELL
jgi:hypothetical protein